MIPRFANGQRLLVWALALGSVASVGLAAKPVVSRFAGADQVWQAVSAAPRPANPVPDRVSLQPVLDLAPFGQAVADRTEALGLDTAASAPAMALQGVVVGATPAASVAIISIDGAAAASFRVGDRVAGDRVLQTIAPDHVTLAADGTLTTLTFPDSVPDSLPDSLPDSMPDSLPDSLPAGETPDAEAAPSDSFLRNLIPVGAAPSEGAASSEIAAAPAGSAPETPDTLRASLLRNPRALLQRYGIAEHAMGYEITDATPPELLQIGLLPGDIITALDGEALTGIASDGPLLDRVAASGTAQITLIRGGAPQNLMVQWP